MIPAFLWGIEAANGEDRLSGSFDDSFSDTPNMELERGKGHLDRITGAALTGAAIGAAAGGVTGMLKGHGVSGENAGYYQDRINQGGVFVSVDGDGGSLNRQSTEDILFL